MLLGLAKLYSHQAIIPFSNFGVGAVALGESGTAYVGYNMEFTNVPLNFTIHAEQCSVINAWHNREKSLTMIVTNVIPCGFCRQFLTELPNSQSLLILTEGYEVVPLSSLLLHPFTPSALAIDASKESFLQYNEVLELSSDVNIESLSPSVKKLLESVLHDGISRSYSPKNSSGRNPSAVALLDSADRVHVGAYLENVAFNPSVSPLFVALVKLVLDNPRTLHSPVGISVSAGVCADASAGIGADTGVENTGGGENSAASSTASPAPLSSFVSHAFDWTVIRECVLVEDPKANYQQAEITRVIVNVLSPACKFHKFDVVVPRK